MFQLVICLSVCATSWLGWFSSGVSMPERACQVEANSQMAKGYQAECRPVNWHLQPKKVPARH